MTQQNSNNSKYPIYVLKTIMPKWTITAWYVDRECASNAIIKSNNYNILEYTHTLVQMTMLFISRMPFMMNKRIYISMI